MVGGCVESETGGCVESMAASMDSWCVENVTGEGDVNVPDVCVESVR